MLVDLPGYGYAEASKSAIAAWTGWCGTICAARASLRRVCLLIDSRHGIKEPDRPVMALCDAAGLSFQVVLTKIDKLGPAERGRGRRSGRRRAGARMPRAHPEIHLTSAEKRLGHRRVARDARRLCASGSRSHDRGAAVARPRQPR